MLYYLGKGKQFKKEECKEYKTYDGVMKAVVKMEDGVVWDENGQMICTMVDAESVPEGALETNPDGSVNAYDEEGNMVGTVDAETVAELTGNVQECPQDETEGQQDNETDDEAANTPCEQETGENGANTKQSEGDEVIVPQGKMRVTVICEGSLNLRRSPAWGNDNICGRAARGQSYFVKEIHKVNGKKMVRTVGDIYMSGESEHVQFEQL